MKKKTISKKASCISFLNNALCKDETSIELMRISLKKQTDRKQKMQKLSNRYEIIKQKQRHHTRTLKASIIELKDNPTLAKLKFLLDPNIYVDNSLSCETRQFLCLVLNTFYKRYNEGEQRSVVLHKINASIKGVIKNIAENEELLFSIQKFNICKQVHLEGETLLEKSKLKQLKQKSKDYEIEYEHVNSIFLMHKGKYEAQKAIVDEQKSTIKRKEDKITKLDNRIENGKIVRLGNQDKIQEELNYQFKFQSTIKSLMQQIEKEQLREKKLVRQIKNKKKIVENMKGNIVNEGCFHDVEMKLVDLNRPHPCNKPEQKINSILKKDIIQKPKNRDTLSSVD